MGLKVAMSFGAQGSELFIEQYKKVFGEMGVEFVQQHCQTEDEIIALARGADVLITVSTIQAITRKVIEGLEKCRYIASIGIGYEGVDLDAANERAVLVSNVPDYCLEEVSDHAMALVMACARKLFPLDAAVRAGRWRPVEAGSEIRTAIWPGISRLKGQTLGLFGFGRIPRTLVPKAKGFGLRVIACDPYVPAKVAEEMGVEMVDFDRLLAESDFLSLHAQLTAETRNMLGMDQFKKMKPSACLINTARGGLVDEKALHQALTGGVLAGAAIDVTEPEPPDPDNPLLKLPNIIVTAHSAHFSPAAWIELWSRPLQQVGELAKGEWPGGLVNPEIKDKYVAKWGPMK